MRARVLVEDGVAVNATVIVVGVTSVTAGVGALKVTSALVVTFAAELSAELRKVVPFPSAIIFIT